MWRKSPEVVDEILMQHLGREAGTADSHLRQMHKLEFQRAKLQWPSCSQPKPSKQMVGFTLEHTDSASAYSQE